MVQNCVQRAVHTTAKQDVPKQRRTTTNRRKHMEKNGQKEVVLHMYNPSTFQFSDNRIESIDRAYNTCTYLYHTIRRIKIKDGRTIDAVCL